LVTIYDDNGSDDVHDWEPVASKVVTEGCEQMDDPDPDDFLMETNHYAIIASSSTNSNGCEIFHLQFYDEDSEKTLSGTINRCTNGLSGKKGSPKGTFSNNDVSIYPTHVDNHLIVKKKPEITGDIRITNTNGQVVQELPLNTQEKIRSISVNNLPDGSYLVSFFASNDSQKHFRIIKK